MLLPVHSQVVIVREFLRNSHVTHTHTSHITQTHTHTFHYDTWPQSWLHSRKLGASIIVDVHVHVCTMYMFKKPDVQLYMYNVPSHALER